MGVFPVGALTFPYLEAEVVSHLEGSLPPWILCQLPGSWVVPF